MIHRNLRFACVAALVFTQGCLMVAGRGSTPRILPRHYGEHTADDRAKNGVPFGPKAVYGKQKPNRLLARDATSCMVSAKKFESTALGATVWCGWLETDR